MGDPNHIRERIEAGLRAAEEMRESEEQGVAAGHPRRPGPGEPTFLNSSGEHLPRPDPVEAANDANRLSDGLPDAVQIAVSLERLHRAQDHRAATIGVVDHTDARARSAQYRQDQAMIRVLKDFVGSAVCDALGISWS